MYWKGIDRSLKEAEILASSGPVKAVFRYAAVRVTLEGALTSCAAHIGMARDIVLVEAYEHGVVVLCRFIDHLLVGKDIYYVTVKPSL